MNKSEQREVQKALNTARTNPHFAAATMSALMRATPKQSSFIELRQICNNCDGVDLMPYMEVVNGCYVAKQPVREVAA